MKKQSVVILTVLLAHLVFWATVLGQQSAGPPQPGQEEKRLVFWLT